MQWLVNIISAVILAQTGYRDRGDAANPDFNLGDLNINGLWHELDLSSVVPEGANLVRIEAVFVTTALNAFIQLRTPGNTGVVNRAANVMQTANRNHEEILLVQPNADRIVEYRTSTGITGTLLLTIGGWWIGPLNLA